MQSEWLLVNRVIGIIVEGNKIIFFGLDLIMGSRRFFQLRFKDVWFQEKGKERRRNCFVKFYGQLVRMVLEVFLMKQVGRFQVI